jgi:hypothetical protein
MLPLSTSATTTTTTTTSNSQQQQQQQQTQLQSLLQSQPVLSTFELRTILSTLEKNRVLERTCSSVVEEVDWEKDKWSLKTCFWSV